VKWRHDRRQGSSIAALSAVVAKPRRNLGELMTAAVEAARAGATIGELTSTLAGPGADRQGASTTPLAAHPYAAAYEQLRDMVDAYARALERSGPGSSLPTWEREGSFSLALTTHGISSKRADSNPWTMTASAMRRPPPPHSLRPERRSQ